MPGHPSDTTTNEKLPDTSFGVPCGTLARPSVRVVEVRVFSSFRSGSSGLLFFFHLPWRPFYLPRSFWFPFDPLVFGAKPEVARDPKTRLGPAPQTRPWRIRAQAFAPNGRHSKALHTHSLDDSATTPARGAKSAPSVLRLRTIPALRCS